MEKSYRARIVVAFWKKTAARSTAQPYDSMVVQFHLPIHAAACTLGSSRIFLKRQRSNSSIFN
jgi:hypothetical protein